MRATNGWVVALVAVLSSSLPAFAHDAPRDPNHSAAVAFAVPLEHITIDGNLADWPDDLPRYRLFRASEPYGATDLAKTKLNAGNRDFSGTFRAGYDADKDLIFLAVEIRDEDHVPFRPDPKLECEFCDACEIYTDGLHAERLTPWYEFDGAARCAAVQHVGVAGDGHGGAYANQWLNPGEDNPLMYGTRGKDTKTQFAWKRDGDVTIYEWAVQAYDRFPRATDLKPGARIGFDLVGVDLDRHDGKVTDAPAWVPFGRARWRKFDHADSLGDLVCLPSKAVLGSVSAKVTDATPTAKLAAGMIVELWQGPLPAGEFMCDDEGRFTARLPAGDYALKPAADRAEIAPTQTNFTVKGGEEARVELSVERLNDVAILGEKTVANMAAFYQAMDQCKETDALALLKDTPKLAVSRQPSNGYPAITIAAPKGLAKLTVALLDAGADVKAVEPGHGGTALHGAAWNALSDVAALLIQHGASVDATDREGWTPLMCVAESYAEADEKAPRLAVARILLDSGANPKAVNKSNQTAADVAGPVADRNEMRALLSSPAK